MNSSTKKALHTRHRARVNISFRLPLSKKAIQDPAMTATLWIWQPATTNTVKKRRSNKPLV